MDIVAATIHTGQTGQTGRNGVECRRPDGELLATVTVDGPHTSSVAFVGSDLDLLRPARPYWVPPMNQEHP